MEAGCRAGLFNAIGWPFDILLLSAEAVKYGHKYMYVLKQNLLQSIIDSATYTHIVHLQ